LLGVGGAVRHAHLSDGGRRAELDLHAARRVRGVAVLRQHHVACARAGESDRLIIIIITVTNITIIIIIIIIIITHHHQRHHHVTITNITIIIISAVIIARNLGCTSSRSR